MNSARLSLILTATVSGAALLNACERDRPDLRTDNVELQRRENARAAERAANDAREAADRAAHEAREAREAADRVPRDALPTSTRADFRAALGEIALARCAHEERCNQVGAGRRYQSMQACRTVVDNELSRDLNPAECNAGIDRAELRECMGDIHRERCDNPIDTITRLAACRTSDLCRNAAVGMR